MACECLGKIIFNFMLIIFTLPIVILVGINNLIWGCFPGTAACLQPLSARITAASWTLMMWVCCCIVPIKKTGVDEVKKDMLAGNGKPRLMIFNHLSFFDTILICTIFPLSVIAQTKMMSSEHLFRMPLIGTIVKGPGHFKVPFKSQETKKEEAPAEGAAPLNARGSVADFAVDKDEIAKVMAAFEAHVASGKIGAWFPEGRMNPHPKEVQQFRAGGFAIATHIDTAIYCGVFAGFEVFWNRKSALGGVPSNCAVHTFKLCDSSYALAKELAGGDDSKLSEKEKCVLIANHAQKRIQEERDRIVNDGWVTQLPEDSPVADKAKDEKKEPLVELGAQEKEETV